MNYFVNDKLLRLYSIIITAIIIPSIIHGQVTVPGAPVYTDINAYGDRIAIAGRDGAPFINTYSNIEGSPYFIVHYCPATLKLNKGKEYKNILTKVNLFTQEIFVIDSANTEIIAKEGLVTKISLFDTSGKKMKFYQFSTGYPAIDKNTSYTYYQVLSDGELQLLKFTTKEITEEKNVQSGEISKKFITREEYYTFCNGEIKKFKKDKDGLLEMMRDQKGKIQDYLKDKKINFRNISELTNLFNYYNSITGKKPY